MDRRPPWRTGTVAAMAKECDFDPATAFEAIEPPQQTIPFIFNSPHSGCSYPAAFLAASRLGERAIRGSEDTAVDELFLPAVEFGAPMLRAHFPRAWLDVNREPYELDPRMFSGPLPAYANIRSARVTGGLGTIARMVSDSEEIYARPLRVEEGLARIEQVYMPYHETLRRMLTRTFARFGCAVLVDCHSMPSQIRGTARGRPDFVLGDRFGASCSPDLTDRVEAMLKARNYDVSRNKPYAGGFITEHYGRPQRGLHALQVEVNRGLYLNEQTLQKKDGFDRVRSDLKAVMLGMAELSEGWIGGRREAAE